MAQGSPSDLTGMKWREGERERAGRWQLMAVDGSWSGGEIPAELIGLVGFWSKERYIQQQQQDVGK